MGEVQWCSDKEIASRVSFKGGKIPDIVLFVSPCRSGSTATARMMAEQEQITWYQPLKGILRNISQGQEAHVEFERSRQSLKGILRNIFQEQGGVMYKSLFIKETIGPNTKNETEFNPLNVLLSAGVPKEKIYVVTLLRDPLTTAASVAKSFAHVIGRVEGLNSTDDLVDNYLESVRNVQRIQQQAKELGIPTTSMIYEALRDNHSHVVGNALFERLGVPFDVKRMDGWKEARSLDDFLKKIEEPDIFHDGNDLFADVKKSSGLSYSSKTCDVRAEVLTPEQIAKIYQSRVYAFYNQQVKACRADLGIRCVPEVDGLEQTFRQSNDVHEGHVREFLLTEYRVDAEISGIDLIMDDPALWAEIRKLGQSNERWSQTIDFAERWAALFQIEEQNARNAGIELEDEILRKTYDRASVGQEFYVEFEQKAVAALALDLCFRKYGAKPFFITHSWSTFGSMEAVEDMSGVYFTNYLMDTYNTAHKNPKGSWQALEDLNFI